VATVAAIVAASSSEHTAVHGRIPVIVDDLAVAVGLRQ
jgi:hypothetical protein